MYKGKMMKKKDLLVILNWLKGETMVSEKPFNFNHLLIECMDIEEDDEVDVDGSLDILMMDAYPMYEKLSKTDTKELEEKAKSTPIFNIIPKEMIDESMRSLQTFIDLYEQLMIESDFDYPHTEAIQKRLLNDYLNKYIQAEQYEKCAEIKNKLSELD